MQAWLVCPLSTLTIWALLMVVEWTRMMHWTEAEGCGFMDTNWELLTECAEKDWHLDVKQVKAFQCSPGQINARTLEAQRRLGLCHVYVAAVLGDGPTTLHDRARLLFRMERVHKMLQRICVCFGCLF